LSGIKTLLFAAYGEKEATFCPRNFSIRSGRIFLRYFYIVFQRFFRIISMPLFGVTLLLIYLYRLKPFNYTARNLKNWGLALNLTRMPAF
jgi:hypothetical protein